MALEAGTCTVNADKTVTGTGLAKAIAEAQAGCMPVSRFGSSTCAGMKTFAEALAGAIVEHILANAEVTVTIAPTDAGLQRTPDPNTPSAPTLGPTSDVVLTGSIG